MKDPLCDVQLPTHPTVLQSGCTTPSPCVLQPLHIPLYSRLQFVRSQDSNIIFCPRSCHLSVAVAVAIQRGRLEQPLRKIHHFDSPGTVVSPPRQHSCFLKALGSLGGFAPRRGGFLEIEPYLVNGSLCLAAVHFCLPGGKL